MQVLPYRKAAELTVEWQRLQKGVGFQSKPLGQETASCSAGSGIKTGLLSVRTSTLYLLRAMAVIQRDL